MLEGGTRGSGGVEQPPGYKLGVRGVLSTRKVINSRYVGHFGDEFSMIFT